MTKHEWKVGDQARYMGSYEEMKSLVGQDVVIHELLCQSLISIRFSNGYMYWVNPNCLEPIPSPKDPFAPGEYVTSIHDYVGVFGSIKNIRLIYKISGQSRPDTFENEGGFVLQKSDFRPATPEEIAAYKAKYEAKPEVEPNPTPQPRMTFTVGGQKFYVGQQVWNAIDSHLASKGDALEVAGSTTVNGKIMLAVRKVESSSLFRTDIKSISTTPPAPHEWKRGDWARHEDGRKAFVCGAWLSHGAYGPQQLVVSFENEAITGIPASEFTFIGHTEAPE